MLCLDEKKHFSLKTTGHLFESLGVIYKGNIIAMTLHLTHRTSKGLVRTNVLGNKYFWFKYDLDRSTTHPKFDPTGVRTHDLQIKMYILCH